MVGSQVEVGLHSQSGDETAEGNEFMQSVSILEMHLHDDYDGENTMANDVCLLKVETMDLNNEARLKNY